MILILLLIIFGIDFGSKMLVSNFIGIDNSIPLIKDFLYITYVKNTGVAWSLFDNKMIFIIIISFLIIFGIILYVSNNKPSVFVEKLSYSLILGGAIGNFVDRIIHGCVIDFIDVRIFGYNYPIFNFADMFIVIGVMILVIYTWRNGNGYKGNGKRKRKN